MKAIRLSTAKTVTAYVYILPFLVLFLVFGLFPILYSFGLSFAYFRGGSRPLFIGLDNYLTLLADKTFLRSLTNTLFIWIAGHLFLLPGSFILAYLLNSEYIRRKNLFQALFFTPMVTSTIAVSLVFSTLFGERYGVINYALSLAGLSPVEWFHGDGRWIKFVIIVLFVWKWYGWNTVIYFAGMQGIDRDLYECAAIEGAHKGQIMARITVPLMKPVILYSLIQSFVGGMQLFDEPYIITSAAQSNFSGGTNQAGLTIAMYLYQTGFSFGQMGLASAIAYVLMLIIVILSVMSFRFFKEKRS